jgi:hypothetical protein
VLADVAAVDKKEVCDGACVFVTVEVGEKAAVDGFSAEVVATPVGDVGEQEEIIKRKKQKHAGKDRSIEAASLESLVITRASDPRGQRWIYAYDYRIILYGIGVPDLLRGGYSLDTRELNWGKS